MEGNDHDPLAAFALQLQASGAELGHELTAFAARLAGVGRGGLSECVMHVVDEIENDY